MLIVNYCHVRFGHGTYGEPSLWESLVMTNVDLHKHIYVPSVTTSLLFSTRSSRDREIHDIVATTKFTQYIETKGDRKQGEGSLSTIFF